MITEDGPDQTISEYKSSMQKCRRCFVTYNVLIVAGRLLGILPPIQLPLRSLPQDNKQDVNVGMNEDVPKPRSGTIIHVCFWEEGDGKRNGKRTLLLASQCHYPLKKVFKKRKKKNY